MSKNTTQKQIRRNYKKYIETSGNWNHRDGLELSEIKGVQIVHTMSNSTLRIVFEDEEDRKAFDEVAKFIKEDFCLKIRRVGYEICND